MKKKNDLDFRFVAYQIECTDGYSWCVEYPDIPAVVGGGKTKILALKDAEDNLKAYIGYLKKHKKPIPAKTSYRQKYSGRVTLRISKELHKTICQLSDFNGVSLNSYINEALIEKSQRDCK